METSYWALTPRVGDAIQSDVVTRDLVDAIHDAMVARSITAAHLARHLRQTEAEVRALLADPAAHPITDLVRVLRPLGLTVRTGAA